MNAPFMLLNTMQSGSNSPLGVLVPQSTASTGANGLTGDAAFATALVQAIFGQSGSSDSHLTNMNVAAMLSNVASVEFAEGKANRDDLLASLFRQWNGTEQLTTEQSELLAPTSLNATLSNMLANLVSAESAEGQRQPGDVLSKWLDGLQNEGSLNEQQDDMSDLLALLELAQVIVQQWQPSGEQMNDTSIKTGSAAADAVTDTMQSDKHGELIRTMQQLVELLNKHPDQPEIVQIVQSFERLLVPLIKEDTRIADRSAQMTQLAQHAGNTIVSEQTTAAVAQALQSNLMKQPVKSAENRSDSQIAFASFMMARGADVKGRLEALAAKAGMQPQIAAVQPINYDTAPESPNESLTNVTDDASEFTLQTNNMNRQAVHNQQPVVQTHFVHADRFAEQMAQAFKTMKAGSSNGLSEVRIMLQPEHLGQVDVKVTMQNGHIVAQFMADTVHGKEMLESQLAQLRSMLHSQGLQVERLEVFQYNPQNSGPFQDSRQRQPQHSGRNHKEESGDFEKTAVDFLTELEQAARSRSTGDDGSINVTV